MLEHEHVIDAVACREVARTADAILCAARQGDEVQSCGSATMVVERVGQDYPADTTTIHRPAGFSGSGRWALGCGTACRRARRRRQPVEGAAREDSERWFVVRTNRACDS